MCGSWVWGLHPNYWPWCQPYPRHLLQARFPNVGYELAAPLAQTCLSSSVADTCHLSLESSSTAILDEEPLEPDWPPTINLWLRKIWLIRSSSEILRAELPYDEDWLLKSESIWGKKKRGHYSMEKESVISFTFCMAAGIVIIFWMAELRRWR